jgi:glycosyltransferase involved in cell wall biosynthesis
MKFFNRKKKISIYFLVDKPNWAFDIQAKEVIKMLGNEFDIKIGYVVESPDLSKENFDLLFIFFWGENYHKQFNIPHYKIIKYLGSHRWENEEQYGFLSPQEANQTYLRDAGFVAGMSLKLVHKFDDVREVILFPQNINLDLFKNTNNRKGPLKIGWVGNELDKCKGLFDILIPAAEGKYNFVRAGGNFTQKELVDFYNEIDVICVASTAEGGPLPLMEGMACGCFPVCVDVGIVPELIANGDNGLIVERSIEGFQNAFKWCEEHLEEVRDKGNRNRDVIIKLRSRNALKNEIKNFFNRIYNESTKPHFRNDDVSFDTDFDNFKKFCNIFHKYGYNQLHGITLRGTTNPKLSFNGVPSEYEGQDSIVNLSNEKIKVLSQNQNFEDRKDIIDFLNSSKDEIALHGLYHTDYSKMTKNEQLIDIEEGLKLLKKLFPNKIIRYFIAPFNKTNDSLYQVCKELDLKVLEAREGYHLEEGLQTLKLEQNTWYRYHHHRFYPHSTFDHYDLSLDKLEEFFQRNLIINGKK